MNPLEKWFAILYIAWGGLLLVSAFFQTEPAARRSHLMGVAGFGILLANLFLAANNPFHLILRIVALAVLTGAAVTFFRSRSRLPA